MQIKSNHFCCAEASSHRQERAQFKESLAVFWLVLVLAALLLALACESKPPPDITDPGQLLFLGYTKREVNCAKCHGADGRGGTEGPDIRNVFSKYDAEAILDIIEYGKGEGPEAMPPFEEKLTEAELESLLRFLKRLQVAPSEETRSNLKGKTIGGKTINWNRISPLYNRFLFDCANPKSDNFCKSGFLKTRFFLKYLPVRSILRRLKALRGLMGGTPSVPKSARKTSVIGGKKKVVCLFILKPLLIPLVRERN